MVGLVITIPLSPTLVGSTAFGVSPLTEAAGSLRVLRDPRPAPFYRSWSSAVRPRVHPEDGALLSSMVPTGRWASKLMFPLVEGPRTTLDDQLEALARISPEELADDLHQIYSDGELPPAALQLLSQGTAAGDRLASAVRSYWEVALAPYWLRIRSALDADVVHRLTTAGEAGLYSVLEDLHPEVSLESDVLTIRKSRHESATYEGSGLTLVPSVFSWPLLIVGRGCGRVELIYGARGVGQVWDPSTTTTHPRDDLSALLGKTRATVLSRVDLPISTTQLASQIGASPAGVSQHLWVLHRAGLVDRRRTGRTVWYTQSRLGALLVQTNRR